MENIANPGQQAQEPFNPQEWDIYMCQQCGNKYYEQKLALLRRSPLRDPQGEEKFKPYPVLICTKCGWEVGAPTQISTPGVG